MFIDFHRCSTIFIDFDLRRLNARVSGNLWRPVAACGNGVLALLERLHLEASCETGSLDVAMMMRMRMLMNDDKDED